LLSAVHDSTGVLTSAFPCHAQEGLQQSQNRVVIASPE
jgi:hypothetical protein